MQAYETYLPFEGCIREDVGARDITWKIHIKTVNITRRAIVILTHVAKCEHW